MSNSLLESLWARVTANIGDRIDQISELLTQALSASAESKAARDAAAASATEAKDGLIFESKSTTASQILFADAGWYTPDKV